MLDLDRDGFITKEEFIQVHISTFQMNYGAQFLYELWRKDFLIYPPHPLHFSFFLFQASKTLDKKQIEMVFERFDLNKDGRLSKDEFQKLMTKYSN